MEVLSGALVCDADGAAGGVEAGDIGSDMYLSTLRSYIEAMGGQLDIRAVFPGGEVVLERLGDTNKAG